MITRMKMNKRKNLKMDMVSSKKCRRIRKNHSASDKEVAHHLKEEEILSTRFLTAPQITTAVKETNRILTNAQLKLHTHQISQIIFC